MYIFLFDPENLANYHVGEKNDWKGMKKGEKMHIFPPIGKKYAYFFPNWHKIYKITKKRLKIFAIVINFLWGKNMIQERGGGAKYEFQI